MRFGNRFESALVRNQASQGSSSPRAQRTLWRGWKGTEGQVSYTIMGMGPRSFDNDVGSPSTSQAGESDGSVRSVSGLQAHHRLLPRPVRRRLYLHPSPICPIVRLYSRTHTVRTYMCIR
ncbi:hypothetical protein F5Y05DRAFT_362095 [Hypoxylon sp. FL0543]|nr:hypothetical protein F5Y05DRAFT_362095 [Hypoxylon sp. FL0543]